MQKVLYIVAGANGAGKTTFGKRFSEREKLVFINADEIAFSISNNIDSVKITAGKLFIKKVNSLLEQNDSFLIETTLAGKYLLKLLNKAKSKNFLITMIYIFVPNQIMCEERIKHRVKLGGNNISPKEVNRRYIRSLRNFPLYRNLCDITYVIYNGDGDFEEIAIFKKNNAEIINPELFEEFMRRIKDG